MAQTLQGYITQVQRLLHDANGNFYSQQQLTDYINSARERVVRDTGCLREIIVSQVPCQIPPGSTINGVIPTYPVTWQANTLYSLNQFIFSNIYIYQVTSINNPVTWTNNSNAAVQWTNNSGNVVQWKPSIFSGLSGSSAPPYPSGPNNNNYPPNTEFLNGQLGLTYVGNCENIYWNSLTNLMGSSPLAASSGNTILDIVNINLYWGNTRIPLRYLPWTQFNAELRFWQNYIGRPIAFSVYGQGNIYISPVPDQSYQIEIDCIVLPLNLLLADPLQPDTINDPFSTPVQFYAAYLAKYYEQSYGEAEIYKQEYIKHIQSVLVSINTRRMPNPYSVTY